MLLRASGKCAGGTLRAWFEPIKNQIVSNTSFIVSDKSLTIIQRWSKVAISGEITVSGLPLTVRSVLETIFDWLQAVSATFHAQPLRKYKEQQSINFLLFN